MSSITLPADARDVLGKKVDKLRKEGKVPGVLYGHDTENKSFSVDLSVLNDVLKRGGASKLIDLALGKDKPVKVLVQDIQRDVVSGQPVHLDLLQVNMDQKITTDIKLNYIGVSKAVKELGGVLVKNMSELTIECLPQYLVDKIDVDISSLETFEDMIKIKDLQIPEGIKLEDGPDLVVVNVQPPRSEEELKALDEEVEDKVDEVEGVDDKKKEEGAGEDEEKDEKQDGKKEEAKADKK